MQDPGYHAQAKVIAGTLPERHSFLAEDWNVIERVSLYCEILQNAQVMLSIYDLNENYYVWFNGYARSFFSPGVSSNGLSGHAFLKNYLHPDYHEWWHKRIEHMLQNENNTFTGIYKLNPNCGDHLFYSIASTSNFSTFPGNSHFIEVAMLIDPNLIKNMKYNETSTGRNDITGSPSFNKLSRRQKEIVKLILKGYKSQNIADLLGLSLHTVQAHRKNIRKKLDVKNLAWQGIIFNNK
nr:helix-turn-helix transcriptional regulator [Bacteroidota bacterium]